MAVNRSQFVPTSASLVDSRTDSDYQDLGDEIDRQEDDSNASLRPRIRTVYDEIDSSLLRAQYIAERLANSSLTPGGRLVPTGAGD